MQLWLHRGHPTHSREKLNSRGFPLSDKDARQRQLERGLHHFDRQRLQLQRQVGLGRRRAGVTLQVDVRRGQNLTMALVLLHGVTEAQDEFRFN